jgi:hypothetical protein
MNIMTLRSTCWIILVTFLIGLTTVVEGAQPGQPSAERISTFDERLTELGIKLFELNVEVPQLYMRTMKEEGAGDGLFSRLFNDPITVLEIAVEKNDQNVRARFYLAKAYFAKSTRGEGKWSRSLLAKAESQFSLLLSRVSKKPVPSNMVREARRSLDDIRKIQERQGELVD